MKKKIHLALILVLVLSYTVNGQIVPPPIPPPPPPGLPIDGGVLFLILSGLFYGVKKLRK